MKINEIVFEDTNAEDELSDGEEGTLTANLLPVLMFLRKRSEDKELSPKLRTDSLIQLVQNAGDTTFDYNALVNSFENNESVKELIKSFNKDSIELTSDADTDKEHGGEEHSEPEQNPEETVKKMAKKASKNRE